MREDQLMARRLLGGDEKAFRDLFERSFPRLYRYALARLGGDREEARDIVQQTFCKVFEALGTYRGEAPLDGWIYRICRNALIDRARRQSSLRDYLTVSAADETVQAVVETLRAPEQDEPDQALRRVGLLELIQATFDLLPAHYGTVLEWKYVEERSVDEIAKRLAVAPKAAESLLARARQAFREAIVALRDSDALPPDLGSERKG
jgi:RNA polymerase sigma-70 factor (ECF subfamily)